MLPGWTGGWGCCHSTQRLRLVRVSYLHVTSLIGRRICNIEKSVLPGCYKIPNVQTAHEQDLYWCRITKCANNPTGNIWKEIRIEIEDWKHMYLKSKFIKCCHSEFCRILVMLNNKWNCLLKLFNEIVEMKLFNEIRMCHKYNIMMSRNVYF